MEISPVRVVSLKGHPELNERWLQNEIKNDVTILGLGDLIVRDVERRQPQGGRLTCSLLTPMVRLAIRGRFSWARRMNLTSSAPLDIRSPRPWAGMCRAGPRAEDGSGR